MKSIDLFALQQLNELSLGAEPLLPTLINEFKASAPKILGAMRDHENSKNLPNLKQQAHQLKSLCATLGITAAATLCEKIEHVRIMPPDLKKDLDLLDQNIQEALAELQQYLASQKS